MASISADESSHAVEQFRDWLQQNNAFVHPSIQFVKNPYGYAVYTSENLSSDSTIISCPFPLAITPQSSKNALSTLGANEKLEVLSERELICTYLIVHLLLKETPHNNIKSFASHFIHLPYLQMLPPVSALRTPLHFTEEEFSLLHGTNLFGATLDRKAERETEWNRCKAFICSVYPQWEGGFTRERYLTMATYLSSRAFPSTLLSENPSLTATGSSHPVLLPGLDSLNHARGHPVSWVVTPLRSVPSVNQISLVIRVPTSSNEELYNNYGPKPNSELILGYGFSLPQNPDDTIVLKIGGVSHSSSITHGEGVWEIGRNVKGADKMWDEMKVIVKEYMVGDMEVDDGEEEPMEWETELETADTLTGMLRHKMSALPIIPEAPPHNVRRDVLEMVQHYVEGQISVLGSLIAFVQDKRNLALQMAAQGGFAVEMEDNQAA